MRIKRSINDKPARSQSERAWREWLRAQRLAAAGQRKGIATQGAEAIFMASPAAR